MSEPLKRNMKALIWILFFVIFLLVLTLFIIVLTFVSCKVEAKGLLDTTKNFEFRAPRFVPLDSGQNTLDKKYEKWSKTNPSIALLGDSLVITYRLTRSYMGIHKRSKIGVCILDRSLVCKEEFVFEEFPSRSLLFKGYEDPRVFVTGGKVYAIAVVPTKLPVRAVPIAKLHLLELDLKERKIKSDVNLSPDFENILNNQKNWNPFLVGTEQESKLLFTQRIEPHTVVEIDFTSGSAKKLHCTSHPFLKILLASKLMLNGGSNSIKFGDKGEMLGVCHTKRRYGMRSNMYKSIFYTFSDQPPYQITRFSREFSIPVKGEENTIQMITGMIDCASFNDSLADFILLTFGIMDKKMLGALMKKSLIENLLNGDTSSRALTQNPLAPQVPQDSLEVETTKEVGEGGEETQEEVQKTQDHILHEDQVQGDLSTIKVEQEIRGE